MKCIDCKTKLILLPFKVDGVIKTTWIHPVIAGVCQYQKDGISIYIDDELLNNAFNEIILEAHNKKWYIKLKNWFRK